MEKIPLRPKGRRTSSEWLLPSTKNLNSCTGPYKSMNGSTSENGRLKQSPSLLQQLRQWSKRRTSDDEMFHITATGTTLEESLDCKQCNGGGTHRGLPSCLTPDEFSLENSHYDDFHTIDWQRDLARDRMRHRYFSKKMGESWSELIRGGHDAWSGWMCVLLVGICAGSLAGFIDIGTDWMKDLKEGICPLAIWLNKKQCCWSSNETYYEGDQCDQWLDWGEWFGKKNPTSTYIFSYIIYVCWSMGFALLASLFVKTFAPYACGSGVPEIKTILSGFIIRGYLGKWTLIIKSVAIILSVAAGLSLGKEGPLVHVVCCIGNIVSYLFPKYGKNEAKKREILSAAAAAGVSVAFGAPIGGVLFSLEEVSYYFPLKTLWRSFFCALVAAFVLRSINPFGNDHLVMFSMEFTPQWIIVELVPFVILGVLGGIIGTIFIKANIAWCRLRKTSKLGQYPITEVLVITLITALLNFPNEFTKMNTSQLIKVLFNQCGLNDNSLLCDYKRETLDPEYAPIVRAGPGVYKSLYMLTLALFYKLAITIFTFGIKVPTGLFIPSMAMGAIMGRIIGVGVQHIAFYYRESWMLKEVCATRENCIAPGLYAMIGAAACLGGVTRMTVSLVVIMFEITGSVNYIVPLMAAIMTSKWIGDALSRDGIYGCHINLNEYPFLDNKEEFTHTTTAADFMMLREHHKPLCVISEGDMSVDEIEQLLEKISHNGFPVVVSKISPYLIGFVQRRDLSLALASAKRTQPGINGRSPVYFTNSIQEFVTEEPPANLSKIIDMAPITITAQTPMETVVDMFCKLGMRQVLVISNGRLLDIITKKDVLTHIREMKDGNRYLSGLI